MSKKLLVAASLLAFSTTGAYATCQTFDGFSAGATVGFNVSTTKAKKAEKTLTETKSSTYTSAFDQAGFSAAVQAVQDADLVDDATSFANNLFHDSTAGASVLNLANAAPFADITAGIVKAFAKKAAALDALGATTVLPTAPANATVGGIIGLTAFTIDGTEVRAAGNSTARAGATQEGPAAQRTFFINDVFGEFNTAFNSIAYKYAAKFGGTAQKQDGTNTYTDAETNTQAHKNQVNFGLNFAYGKTFGKFYIGAGLMGEMNTGKTSINEISDVKATTYNALGHVYTLATANANVAPRITMKQKFSFGVRVKPGVTCGDWLFYVPMDMSLTKYEVKFVRDEAATKALVAQTPTYSDSVLVADVAYAATSKTTKVERADKLTYATTTDATFKKSKTKFGYAFGLGAAVKLADNVSLDLAVTYSPYNKIKIDTPAYTSGSMLDATAKGDHHEIKVANYKATLGVSYHF